MFVKYISILLYASCDILVIKARTYIELKRLAKNCNDAQQEATEARNKTTDATCSPKMTERNQVMCLCLVITPAKVVIRGQKSVLSHHMDKETQNLIYSSTSSLHLRWGD